MKNNQNRYQSIGERIREAREAAGLTQSDLAREVGYESPTAISLIESGERDLALEKLEKIADVLHKDIKFFLGQEEQPADIRFALRADRDLGTKDKEKILEFIEFLKNKKRDRRET